MLFCTLVIGVVSSEEEPTNLLCFSKTPGLCKNKSSNFPPAWPYFELTSDNLKLPDKVTKRKATLLIVLTDDITNNYQLDLTSLHRDSLVFIRNLNIETIVNPYPNLQSTDISQETIDVISKSYATASQMANYDPTLAETNVNVKVDSSKKIRGVGFMGCSVNFNTQPSSKTLFMLDNSSFAGSGRAGIIADHFITTYSNYENLRNKISAGHTTLTSMRQSLVRKVLFKDNQWEITWEYLDSGSLVSKTVTVPYGDVRGQLTLCVDPDILSNRNTIIELRSAPGGGTRRGINISATSFNTLEKTLSDTTTKVKFTGDWTNVQMKDIMNVAPGEGVTFEYDSKPPNVIAHTGAAAPDPSEVPPPPGPDKPSNLAAIIGGVVGGIVAVALIIGLSVWYVKRRNNKDSGSGTVEP